MARKLENWLQSFQTYVEQIPSPGLFKKWVGIATLAGVLERRVWVDVGMGPLYPNFYTMLVAPPGVGKTAMTSIISGLWRELSTGDDKGLHLAPASMTAAALIDELRDSSRRFYSPMDPLEPVRYNALSVCANELGTFLPAYDSGMMNNLTDIYDGHGYSERRRWMKGTSDEKGIKIDAPTLNILMATTPGYLTGMLPDGAWDQGFLSRTILVYSGERTIRPLFEFGDRQAELRKELINELKTIFHLYGEISFEKEAKAALIKWHMEGGPPVPKHPRLTNYNTRRTTHLLKLCMIASVAAGDTRVVTTEHFSTALNWLLEVEVLMEDIFKAMVVNADSKAIDECWHFTYQLFVKENRAIAEARIVAFLQERVPLHNVMRMLQVMVSAGILEEQLASGIGKAYKPKARRG